MATKRSRKRSPEVDAYVAEAPDFARPVLRKLRTLFHRGCPKLTETIKWGSPFFEREGLVGSMSAFKRHVAFGFWRGAELSDPSGLLAGVGNTQMSMVRVASVDDLPPDRVIVALVKEAAALNETRAATPTAKRSRTLPARSSRVEVPQDLERALRRNRRAAATFEGFSPSRRRDYVEWIQEAKQDATRRRRLARAVEWLAEGKPRNWKYMKEWR